jgi:hypothetical protein
MTIARSARPLNLKLVMDGPRLRTREARAGHTGGRRRCAPLCNACAAHVPRKRTAGTP